MANALLDGNVTDENDIAVPGALVYVYDGRGEDGGLSTLYDSLGQPLTQPVTTDDSGYWSAYAANDQFYTLAYYWGGRKRYVEANVLLGTLAINLDPGLRADLVSTAAGKGASLVSFASGKTVEDLSSTAAGKGANLVGALDGGNVGQAIRGILRPEMFGAVGDGTTDDTTAVAACFAYQQANGGEVWGTPGKTYLLNTWTRTAITSKLVIRGNGATFKGPVSGTKFLNLQAEIYVEDCVFDRWDQLISRTNAEGGGTVSKIRVLNNEMKNGLISGALINIECTCTDYVVSGNYIHDCATSYAIRIGFDSVANQDNWRGIIANNRIETITAQTTGSLTGYAGGLIAYGRDTVVCGNRLVGITSTTGDCPGIYVKLRNGKVFGNHVESLSTTSGSDIVGINLKGGERGGVTDVSGYDTACWGNTIKSIGTAGSVGVGIRSQSDDQKVFGNVIDNFGLIGINVDESNSPGTFRNTVTDNTIIGTGVAGETGIYLTAMGGQRTVRGNNIKDCAVGIRVGGGNAQAGDCITDNILYSPASGSNYGINITGAGDLTSISIERNRFGGTWTQAIRNEKTAGAFTGWRIVGNIAPSATTKIFCATTTTPASAMPSDAVVEGNAGYLTNSKTMDWASLAAGAVQSTTLTVTGCLVGDKVDVSMSIALSGTRLWGEVTAADTVTIYQQNPTGGAVDLASGTLYATCRRTA